MNLRRYIKKDGSEVIQQLVDITPYEYRRDVRYILHAKFEWQDIPTVYEGENDSRD